MRKSALTDLWFAEFVRNHHCGLCGNTGWIDTRETAVTPAGVRCGDRFLCICPNGRALKRALVTRPTRTTS